MDTQDRIIVKSCFDNESVILYDILISECKQDSIIFSFKEFQKIEIILESYNDIVLESEFPDTDKMVLINPFEPIVLNDFEYNRDSNLNNTFIPETYSLNIIKNQVVTNCYFEVESNTLGKNVNTIRKIVSDFHSGLELDFFKKGKGRHYTNDQQRMIMVLYDKIIDNAKTLYMELMPIIDNPIEDLVKEIDYKRKEGKQTRNVIKKMIKKNIVCQDNKKSYSEVKNLTYDNKENRILKAAINSIIKNCKSVDLYFQTNINYLNKEIDKYTRLVDDKQYELDHISNRNDERYKKKLINEYYGFLESLNNSLETIEQLKIRQNKINKLHNRLNYMVSESWLNKIDGSIQFGYSNRIYKNVHYKRIIDLSNLLNVSIEQGEVPSKSYGYKETSKLYEIYVLILLFEMFYEVGFILDFDYDYDFNIMFETNEFCLVKDNKKIRIQFDQIVRRVEDMNADNLANQNCVNNRPDIVIMVYEDNIMKNCIILEVKCRKFENIYVDVGDTKVVTQLKDYTNFWYLDENKALNKSPVDKVFCVYPSNVSDTKYINVNQIVLHGLRPKYDFKNDDSYISLKEEIFKVLGIQIYSFIR